MKNNAFTMMELLVTVTILSIVVAFTIPNFRKSVEKSHERDMVAQLETLHAANTVYFSNQGGYYIATITDTTNTSVLNTKLNINLISNGGTLFAYLGPLGTAYTAGAKWGGCIVQITQAPLSATNPSRASALGTCPTL